MAKQTFTAGQVLTAAQMNNLQTDIFNQTTSTKTANYSLVVGDRGTRVIGNGTSITFTVDNNIFTAGDTVKIHNINSTVLTIAAGAGVTINAAAGLTMSQWQEATLFATSASSFILFESTASSAQGLTLINTTSFSAVSSQSFNTVFNATYRNYRIVASLKLSSDTDVNFRIRSGTTDLSSAGAYFFGYYIIGNSSSQAATSGNNQNQNYLYVGAYGSWNGTLVMDITAPFATDVTSMSVQGAGRFYLGLAGSLNNNTTSYDGFTLYPNSGTMTGVVNVYGYNA